MAISRNLALRFGTKRLMAAYLKTCTIFTLGCLVFPLSDKIGFDFM